MSTQSKQWDLFLAHAGVDGPAAEALYELLHPHARVFLDSRCLLPGDDWDRELAAAQRESLVTVVLVSAGSESAYYQREEIAAALDMARRDGQAHRVVPVYLDDPEAAESEDLPYGLRLKHGLAAAGPGGLETAAERLCEMLGRLRGGLQVRHERRRQSARALHRLAAGSGRERLDGLREITGVFRPLVTALIAILVVSVLLIGACVLIPGLEAKIDRTLAVSVLGTLCAAVMASLMVVFLRSMGLAREILHAGPSG